jgi:hypothetical protein
MRLEGIPQGITFHMVREHTAGKSYARGLLLVSFNDVMSNVDFT